MISDLERIINIEFICKAKLEILEFGDSIQLTCDPRKEITVTKLVIYYLTYFLAVLLAVSFVSKRNETIYCNYRLQPSSTNICIIVE